MYLSCIKFQPMAMNSLQRLHDSLPPRCKSKFTPDSLTLTLWSIPRSECNSILKMLFWEFIHLGIEIKSPQVLTGDPGRKCLDAKAAFETANHTIRLTQGNCRKLSLLLNTACQKSELGSETRSNKTDRKCNSLM